MCKFCEKTKKTERWMNQMHGLTVLSDDTLYLVFINNLLYQFWDYNFGICERSWT